MRQVITYLDTATLIERGSGIVRFGTAPDGLPFLVTVPAPPRADDLLRQVAWAMGVVTPEPRYEGTPLEPLVRDLNRVLREQLIQRLATEGGGQIEVMILPLAVRSLVGATLLDRLFNPPNRPRAIAEAHVAPITAVNFAAPPPPSGAWQAMAKDASTNQGPEMLRMAEAAAPVPQPRFQVGESCLALPRTGGSPVIVYRVHSDNGWPEYSFRRAYTEEATTFLPESWYERGAGGYGGAGTERVRAGDVERYRRLRAEAPDARWTWQVTRRDFAIILRDLAIQVGLLHERNEVHGDLKPANVLMTASATEPLDSLRLAPGVRAPAMTRGWAAPEQVLGLAVGPQTDQYPLGLLLLGLVGGVLYGEEARVSIPVGGTQLEYHTVLRNPAVYIDPATAPIERSQVDTWRDLIERCVRFDAAERFPSMAEVADALRPLIAAESLNGTVETPLAFGRLVFGSDGVGDPEPCWLVG